MNPIIKWNRTKHFKAKDIMKYFPTEVNTYVDVFVGGGGILGEYLLQLETGKYKCKNIICLDRNVDLIAMWNLVKSNPDMLYNSYVNFYLAYSGISDKEQKKKFWIKTRDNYNAFNKHPNIGDITWEGQHIANVLSFFCLNRTCLNGQMKYNDIDELISLPDLNKNGVTPEKLKVVLSKWHYLLNKYNVKFVNAEYDKYDYKYLGENDYMYMDPPLHMKGKGIYNSFPYSKFYQWVYTLVKNKYKCKYNVIDDDDIL